MQQVTLNNDVGRRGIVWFPLVVEANWRMSTPQIQDASPLPKSEIILLAKVGVIVWP